MIKKNFAIMSFLAIATLASQTAYAAFNDVSDTSTNFDAITYGQDKAIVSGYSDNTFKPDNKINRAEFIKIVVAANNSATDIDACLAKNNNKALFKDTSNAAWYAKYLCQAKAMDVVGGYPDGSFKPDQNINFAEASKIITVAKNGHDAGSSLSGQQTDWYKRYVSFLANSHAIPATILNIGYQITRGEMMEIIYRLDKDITNKFSLNYEQVAGNEMSCMKAGQTAGGVVYPGAPQAHCCTGLVDYARTRDKGGVISGANQALCLEPDKGLSAAVKIMDSANECTSNVDLGQSIETAPYKNLNFNGFSFTMLSYKPICAARCDVNLDTSKATIGWMCMGAM